MEAIPARPEDARQPIDWEAFYSSYRKPGYVPGYEIVNKLGGGVFGMVFKARKESIGKDYAIKFLKVDDEVVRDAVVRELESVRFFAQIDHPNLVSIEDKGEVDGIPYIVMSYAGQDTLRKRLNQGEVDQEGALRIFVQAARGVQALHDHSLVHFDLKPANVFLKGDIARVGDYGLSKLVTESRNSLSFGRGTPYYMAPEMLQRRGDHRSDIYSLGVVLYEGLVGDVPFRGDSEWEVLRKHETAVPTFPDDMPVELRRVVERCLAKLPEDRFASVAELLRALQAPVALGESLVLPPVAEPRPAAAGRASSPEPAPSPEPTGTGRPAPRPAPVRPDPDAAPRDPRESPYGLPWAEPRASRGVLGWIVHLLFRCIEVVIFLALLPVRLVSTVSGRGLVGLLRLPFQLLGFTARVAAFLALALLTVFAMIAVIGLFAG